MTTAIANFESAKLPSFLRAPEGSVTNALAALASGTFPFMSIKGKRFAVVRNKEETIIMRPDDEDTPANAIEVVIVNSATSYAKVFYATGYTEGSKEKPTCFSNDGKAPDPQSTDPQAKKCMTCPHNAWGSGSNGKGKACSDSLRLAIAKADELNDPMLLRVPPASLKAAVEYAASLARKGAPIEGVITKIKFDPAEATPRLIFTGVGFLSESAYHESQEVSKSAIVQQIIGASPVAMHDALPAPKSAPAVEDDEDDTPAPKAKKVASAPVEEEPKPAKKAAAPTAAKAADLTAKLYASMNDDDDDE